MASLPPVTHGNPVKARGSLLIDLDDLPGGGVAEVQTDEHGVLAVGMADGEPFAVGNVCRHQFAKLGRGWINDEGRLVCPWHRACYDVRTGAMVSGPKGRIFGFPPYAKAVQGFGNTVRIQRVDVEIRDGAIHLAR